MQGNTSASGKIGAWPKSTISTRASSSAKYPRSGLTVAGPQPLVGDDVAHAPAAPQVPQPLLVEVHVQVRDAVVSLRVGILEVRLDRPERLLADVGRVADHRVEASFASPSGLAVAGRRRPPGTPAPSGRKRCPAATISWASSSHRSNWGSAVARLLARRRSRRAACQRERSTSTPKRVAVTPGRRGGRSGG